MKQLFTFLYIVCLSTAMKSQDMQYVVLFEFNKTTIPDSSMLGLMKIIAKNSIRDVVIEGHCDSIGSTAYNDALSQHRAAEVKKLLITPIISSILDERIFTLGIFAPKKYLFEIVSIVILI